MLIWYSCKGLEFDMLVNLHGLNVYDMQVVWWLDTIEIIEIRDLLKAANIFACGICNSALIYILKL